MSNETSTMLTITDGNDYLTITDKNPALELQVDDGSSVYIDADDARALVDYLNDWAGAN